MAGMILSAQTRGQFAAIAQLRWRLFVNSLRTTRGKLEMFSRFAVGAAFTVGGIGGAAGMGGAAWFFTSEHRVEYLAVLLWPLFAFWQLFPIMLSAFTQSMDSSHLLRFPMRYRAYFLVTLVQSSFSPATIVGSMWLAGIAVGIAVARVALFPWAVLVLLVFGLFNILLTRMIFAWVERWLAQRRTREVMGVIFFLVMLSFQLVGPLLGRYGERSKPGVLRTAQQVTPFERALPPGLAARAISSAADGQPVVGAGALAFLCAYCAVAVWLTDFRVRAQYRGENLGEGEAREATSKGTPRIVTGWRLPGFSGQVAAVFEKELRYLLRSGPMLLTLIMPLFIMVIFRASGPSGGGSAFTRNPSMAFPLGSMYALLLLTNLVYNNFGSDGTGVQLFYASPVRFRSIVLAKNLAHTAVFAAEMVLVFLGVCLLYKRPTPDVIAATLAAVLFALPVDLAAGNFISMRSPTRVEFGIFGRQRASQTTVLLSLAIRVVIFGVSAVVFFLTRHYGSLWLAVPVFLLLAAVAWTVYATMLNRTEKSALDAPGSPDCRIGQGLKRHSGFGHNLLPMTTFGQLPARITCVRFS